RLNKKHFVARLHPRADLNKRGGFRRRAQISGSDHWRLYCARALCRGYDLWRARHRGLRRDYGGLDNWCGRELARDADFEIALVDLNLGEPEAGNELGQSLDQFFVDSGRVRTHLRL